MDDDDWAIKKFISRAIELCYEHGGNLEDDSDLTNYCRVVLQEAGSDFKPPLSLLQQMRDTVAK